MLTADRLFELAEEVKECMKSLPDGQELIFYGKGILPAYTGKERPDGPVGSSGGDYDAIRWAKRYMESCYSQTVTLHSVAGRVYMSAAYFSTVFKSRTGENFYKYLTKIRMEAAAKLLKNSMCSICEIAGQVGYKQARYFSDAFKRYYGVVPSMYRKL